MPSISLVVCAANQRDLLQRLLENASGCYDDFLVVHDGSDTTDVGAIVRNSSGRFYERPLARQQEAHWPFAWEHAAFDWILRLDADEFPSPEMKTWLQQFRNQSEPVVDISGYTCIWPLWNGRRQISNKIWAGRIFLFSRQRVRFFGMPEQTPMASGRFESTDLTLHHRPRRKSYGFHNLLIRRQGHRWRQHIAKNLLGAPTQLACWRWTSGSWCAHSFPD